MEARAVRPAPTRDAAAGSVLENAAARDAGVPRSIQRMATSTTMTLAMTRWHIMWRRALSESEGGATPRPPVR
eukprot:1606902-Prymnesium_polylepis.1